ncbi:metalloregulator ArsR/SmtB family transcription factor [Thalassobaculum sp.]|uniref:ArsR/SmtB family transcription factor n=1 Tax=Thalassobaculum sp. TaxID=2022740 RepID=UPI0032EE7681
MRPVGKLNASDLHKRAGDAAALLKIMANDKRLLVLCELADAGERTVTELEGISGLSQSALSQHLARMRHHGIVKTRRSAQSIFYSLASHEARVIIEALCRLYLPQVDTVPGEAAESAAAS